MPSTSPHLQLAENPPTPEPSGPRRSEPPHLALVRALSVPDSAPPDRWKLNGATLLTVSEAAAALGTDVTALEEWLSERAPVRVIAGTTYVLWADIVTASLPPESPSREATRAARLRQLGTCNVLTVPEAIAELGVGKERGREWLEAHKLIHHAGPARRGGGRVVVGEMIEALKSTRRGTRRVARAAAPMPLTSRF